jgi:hypothetical protein
VAAAAIRQRPVGKALSAPIKDDDGEAPRPQIANGLEIFLDPFGGYQRAKRSETPSGVLSVPVTMPSGTGFAGIETSFTGSGGLRGSVFPASVICVCIAPSYSSRQP